MAFGRESVVIVELVQDYCDLTYGVSPCAAALGVTGSDKCYNTYRTCQSAANYAKSADGLVLRFCQPTQQIPLEWNAIPSLVSASIKPTVLNIGGSAAASGALGERGSCSLTFTDHPDGDIKTDPYLVDRSHDPFTTGTFWSKWMARNVYYKNRIIRIRQGYIDEAMEDMKVSYYVIDKAQGPDSNGRVSISGSDVLRLVDNEKAQVPEVSNGELSADITESTTSFNVTGALLSEYDSPSGTIRIGDEIMTYTGISEVSGVITFTGVTRGTDGSTAEEHDAEEKVQKCLRYIEELPHDVAYSLMVTHGPISSTYIPYADWDAEASVWLPQFSVTTLISQPTGIKTLLASLTQECMFYIWWDERVQEIKLRAIRPPTETPVEWNINGHILEGSQNYREDPNQRASRVYVYYQPKDWAAELDSDSNYRKVRLSIDPSSESENEYDESQIKKIYCRFIRTDGQALNLGSRFLARYRDSPRYLTVKVDAENRDTWTADIVDVTSDLFVDFIGNRETRRFQVISAKEVQPGEVIQYDMQSSIFIGGKFAFYMANDAPTYTNATEVERLNGAWYADDDWLLPDGSAGYTYQ